MFAKMTPQHAKIISAWTYPGEYACYSMSQDKSVVDELINTNYYAALDTNGEVYGYVCFGQSARIPTVEAAAYDERALDIGLGLSPRLCGQGRGLGFISDCLSFAQQAFDTNDFRLTVAAFNARAVKVYKRVGFIAVKTVQHARSQQSFTIMRLKLTS